MPKEGFSVTALKSADTNDYTILIETMDAKEGQSVTFRTTGGLSAGDLLSQQGHEPAGGLENEDPEVAKRRERVVGVAADPLDHHKHKGRRRIGARG